MAYIAKVGAVVVEGGVSKYKRFTEHQDAPTRAIGSLADRAHLSLCSQADPVRVALPAGGRGCLLATALETLAPNTPQWPHCSGPESYHIQGVTTQREPAGLPRASS
jgi:hypothetical protein